MKHGEPPPLWQSLVTVAVLVLITAAVIAIIVWNPGGTIKG